MEAEQTRTDAIPAREVASVIKEQLVDVVVRMEERQVEGVRVGLERPRTEGAHGELLRDEGGMHRRRQVVARTGDRS